MVFKYLVPCCSTDHIHAEGGCNVLAKSNVRCNMFMMRETGTAVPQGSFNLRNQGEKCTGANG